MATKQPTGKNPSIINDMAKVAYPILVPLGVDMIMGLVPKGSTADQVIEKYHEYWEKVSPALTFMILRFTNNKDIVDDVLTELSAEINKALKSRFGVDQSQGGKVSTPSVPMEKMEKVIIATTRMEPVSQANFFNLLIGIVDEHQRNRFSNYLLEKETSVNTLTVWSQYSQAGFQKIVDMLTPPHVESELTKQVKKGLKDFGSDAGSFLRKKSPLELYAEKISGKSTR